MDHSSNPKSPEFNLDAYDFNTDPSAAALDPFNSYGSFPDSPRLTFSLSAPHASTSNTAASNFFNAAQALYTHADSSPTSHSFSSSGRSLTPIEGTISPPLLGHYPGSAQAQAQAHSMSTGSSDMDGVEESTARRSTTNSPVSSYNSSSLRAGRYNPMAPSKRPAKRSSMTTRRSSMRHVEEDDLSDEEGDGNGDERGGAVDEPSSAQAISQRRENIRKQRIESEQRRRDELRDGYAKLKATLPVSNQKSSKVSLLDRAVTHIRHLEALNNQLQTRLDQAEGELPKLRATNDRLMRDLTEQHRAVTLSALAAATAQASAHSQSGSEPNSPNGRKKKSPSF